MNIFTLVAIFGIIFVIVGTSLISSKKIRESRIYLLLIFGGICLEVYSIYIGDLIFIVLQGVFIMSSIYGLIKASKLSNEKLK